jgi:hypothetical protein
MSIEWISHQGKKILYIKYSKLTAEEAHNQILEATKALVATKQKDNLTLSDLREFYVDKDFIELSKEQGKISKGFTKKAAVLGIEGIKKLILKTVNTVSENPREPFESMDDAKNWLVSDK